MPKWSRIQVARATARTTAIASARAGFMRSGSSNPSRLEGVQDERREGERAVPVALVEPLGAVDHPSGRIPLLVVKPAVLVEVLQPDHPVASLLEQPAE